LAHCYPNPSFPQKTFDMIQSQCGTDANIFTTYDQMVSWHFDKMENSFIIEHGIDTDRFAGWKYNPNGKILTVANEYKSRGVELGYDIYEEVVSSLGNDKFFHVGKSSDGTSEPAKSYDDLVGIYNSCGIFLNTCHRSVLPTTLLEAMSVGAPVVSMPNPTINWLIVNGENGFVVEDAKQMIEKTNEILSNRDLAEKIGKNARETVVSRYNTDRFVNKWNDLFYSCVKK